MDLDRYEEWLLIYAKGFAMGCADAVPGVSGGTIALITGIYERLIEAVTSVNATNILEVASAVNPSNFDRARDAFLEMDAPFMIVLGTGILSALVLVLRLMHYLLSEFPVLTYGFFFGLIAVSAVILLRVIDFSDPASKVSVLAGFSAAFLVSGYATTALGHSLPIVFLSGMVAVSAMVLPGISGSLLLIILGQYEYMTGALSGFTDAFVAMITSGSTVLMVESAPPVTVFVSGAVVGLFTVAHTVRKALEHHRHATMAFLVSLVAGALRAPVEEVNRILLEQGGTWTAAIPEFGTAALAGGSLVLLIDYKAGLIDY